MSEIQRCFAIIPAAGRSVRMGTSKLLLDLDGRPIIDHVLDAWTHSRVTCVIIVVRQNDNALRQKCEQWPVDLVYPDSDPVDMKESVQIGLRHAETVHDAGGQDFWLLAPADLPTLGASLINQLIDFEAPAATVVAPRFGERVGHPVRFPWKLAAEVFELGPHEGVNALVSRHKPSYVDLPPSDRLNDIDTPEDYHRLLDDARREP